MNEKISIHAYVSGRVQGVFYRDSTQKKATTLGVTGWVKNLPDGRVELVASGNAEQVDALIQWLWEGSSASEVTSVESERVEFQEYSEFIISR